MTGFEQRGKGVIRRSEKRMVGIFIDGTGLDRATRRIKRKVDLAALVRGVSSGLTPAVARYYTLIPYEDDSRQRAFLDAVHRAGLAVIVKRLPPKGVSRQVAVDVEMASDIIAFARGVTDFNPRDEYRPEYPVHPDLPKQVEPAAKAPIPEENGTPIKRIVTLVCPSRDLSYPISLIRDMNVDTVTADFGKFNSGDILKSAAKWVDLSDSETIWRD